MPTSERACRPPKRLETPLPCVANGLHAVRYMVIEQAEGAVLSIADDKREALATARRLLSANDDATSPDASWQQASLWPDDQLPVITGNGEPLRQVSRRRREIFDKCGGRCHYCHATLTLDGKWHVEHMRPRALDGTDAAINLLAACAPCNLAKRDRTAVEFVLARRA